MGSTALWKAVKTANVKITGARLAVNDAATSAIDAADRSCYSIETTLLVFGAVLCRPLVKPTVETITTMKNQAGLDIIKDARFQVVIAKPLAKKSQKPTQVSRRRHRKLFTTRWQLHA